MKKIRLFIPITFLAVMFSSCGKDEEVPVYQLEDYENSIWLSSDSKDTLRFTTVKPNDGGWLPILPNVGATYYKEPIYESHLEYFNDVKKFHLTVVTLDKKNITHNYSVYLYPNGRNEMNTSNPPSSMYRSFFRVK